MLIADLHLHRIETQTTGRLTDDRFTLLAHEDLIDATWVCIANIRLGAGKKDEGEASELLHWAAFAKFIPPG